MTPHPDDRVLILALDGELDDSADVDRHLAGCPECRARMQRYARLTADIAGLHRAPRRSRWWWWIPVAAAACLAAAALVSPTPERKVTVPVAAVERPLAPAPEAPAPPPGAGRAAPVRNSVKERPFIPLPFSDQALPLGEPVVVRVSVPVDSLRLASIRVDRDSHGRRVLADVMLGMDGLPRAIRFVD